jgi:hypothetical protein
MAKMRGTGAWVGKTICLRGWKATFPAIPSIVGKHFESLYK